MRVGNQDHRRHNHRKQQLVSLARAHDWHGRNKRRTFMVERDISSNIAVDMSLHEFAGNGNMEALQEALGMMLRHGVM